ncbi:trypsin-like serine peptidase [Crinalium epipsammum]|uniref:trypsin-like serine peptidase n=1 Tax=Crinalium epipsammum TaxID=241425 RepID=UPI0002EA8F78|nr:serine protease [Crinalium epipsammum]
MTNYHVVKNIILSEEEHNTDKSLRSASASNESILRFDFKILANTLNKGTEYRLDQDWLIDKSSDVTKNQLPQPDKLDYALLRVDGEPGNKPIGASTEGSVKRGWIEIPTNAHEFKINQALFILQHPLGEPLKLAFDLDVIKDIDPSGTLIKYRTNTDYGSSGSPCFDSNWNLVALHHTGSPSYNAGTPVNAIVKLLDQRNILEKILSRQPI